GIILAFVGIRTFSELNKRVAEVVSANLPSNDIFDNMVKVIVGKKVADETLTLSGEISKLSGRVDLIDDGLKFFRLKMVVDEIKLVKRFSNTERDALLDGLNELK